MQKKSHLILFLLSLPILFTPYSTLAASPMASPSATPSLQPKPAEIDEVTQNLKKRLQDSLQESTPAPVSSALSYVGVVKDIIKDTVIIEDKDGKRDIKIQQDTNILRAPGNTTIKPENIRIDDFIIAIGYPGQGEDLSGRRLIVSTQAIKPPAKTSALGVIKKLGKTSLTITVNAQDNVVATTSKTIFKSSTGTIEPTDLSEGDTVIYTATIGQDQDLTATHIMRVRSSAIGE